MPSRKPRHKTRHSTPTSSTSVRDTSTHHARSAHHSSHSHQLPTSSVGNNSLHRTSPTYRPLTPVALSGHEQNQVSLYGNPSYVQGVQTQHADQLVGNVSTLGINLPAHLQTKVAQDLVGIMPSEHFEADSAYPYRQYNSYQPIQPYQSPHTQYPTTAAHGQYVSPSLRPEVSDSGEFGQTDGRDPVYSAPQLEYYVQTAAYGDVTGPGNDLAATGTQFDGHFQPGYAQTSM